MTYKVQIDNQINEATPEQIERIDRVQLDAQTVAQEAAEAAAIAVAARASALNKLTALGLTEAEIAVLIGA